MRIDDLNRASQSPEASKADAVRTDQEHARPASSTDAHSDAATISQMATVLGTNDARLDALRLQVERGEYRVSASDVAASIIDEHTVG